jgi:hypothetical protein
MEATTLAQTKKPLSAISILMNGIGLLSHPLFVPLYVMLFLLFIHPQVFVGYNPYKKFQAWGMVAVSTVLFPMFTVLVMRALGFVKSILLNDQKERMVVSIATMLFYFWVHYMCNGLGYPKIVAQFYLGVFISIPSILIATYFLKISLHAIAWGSALCFLIFVAIHPYYDANIYLYLAIACALSGLVLTSRLVLKAHTQQEIYLGLLVGVLCQVVAYLLK